MKHWAGKAFEYRGFKVHNNKREHFLEVYKKMIQEISIILE